MREVVESAKEATDHDQKIERVKRRMFAANTKAAQFPEAEIRARQKQTKQGKKKRKPPVFLSDKQRNDAEKEFNSKNLKSTLASAIDAIKDSDKKEEGDARESLERNSIECPNFLFSLGNKRPHFPWTGRSWEIEQARDFWNQRGV